MPIPLPPLLTLVDSFPLVGRGEPWSGAGRGVGGGGHRRPAGRPRARRGRRRQDAAAHRVRPARPRRWRGGALRDVLGGTVASRTSRSPRRSTTCSACVDPATAVARFGAGACELARLVPQHAADLGLPLPVGHGDPDTERARLFGPSSARSPSWPGSARARSCIDDLHWARRPTIDLLGQLVHDQTPDATCSSSCPTAPRPPTPVSALRSAAARPAPPPRRRPACRWPASTCDGITDFVAAAAGHDVGDRARRRRRRARPPDRRQRLPARRAVAAPRRQPARSAGGTAGGPSPDR